MMMMMTTKKLLDSFHVKDVDVHGAHIAEEEDGGITTEKTDFFWYDFFNIIYSL